MTLKFYTDEHISKQVAFQLRKNGVDVVTCHDVNMIEASDEEHLTYATAEKRVDKDFPILHAQWQKHGKQHGGIFRVSPKLQGDRNIGVLVSILLEFHELIKSGAGTYEDDISGQIFYIG